MATTPRDGDVDAADALARVRWDYDAEDELLSPLVATERYFRDFPWNGEGDDAL